MRRSFDGLCTMTESIIRQDPFSGHLFVFRNKRKDRVKVLYWDRDGFAIWYKRLEQGTFKFREDGGGGVEIEACRLLLILEGIDLSGLRKHKRYSRRSR
jgi:transposase